LSRDWGVAEHGDLAAVFLRGGFLTIIEGFVFGVFVGAAAEA